MDSARLCFAHEILDYGCGKQRLKILLEPHGFLVRGYDPAIPGLDQPPQPCDYVACIDVLEHIEPELLIPVLKDLHRVTLKDGFFSLATTLSQRSLPDGTNTHRIVQPIEWWVERLGEFFELSDAKKSEHGHYAMTVKRRPVV